MTPVAPWKKMRRSAARKTIPLMSPAALKDCPAALVQAPDVMELLLDTWSGLQAMEFYIEAMRGALREKAQETQCPRITTRSAEGSAQQKMADFR